MKDLNNFVKESYSDDFRNEILKFASKFKKKIDKDYDSIEVAIEDLLSGISGNGTFEDVVNAIKHWIKDFT